jgi:hydrogenase nickel incorporation protein HypA/HybF
MHEYSIVSALLTQVEGHARRHGAGAVHRVRVSLGELSGVDPELLAAAYDLARAGGVCAAAALEVETVAARWECPRCAVALPPRSRLACAACGTPARLAAGDEIVLASLEMEVMDAKVSREESHV